LTLHHQFKALLNINDDVFVIKTYEELLNRSPSQAELSKYYYSVDPRKYKHQLILELIRTSEASSFYKGRTPVKSGTIAEQLRRIIMYSNDRFVNELYKELLNREPDKKGFSDHLAYLNNGGDRYILLIRFVESEEFTKLLFRPPVLNIPKTSEVGSKTSEINPAKLMHEIRNAVINRVNRKK
jgi:hypothetical protein